MTLHLGGPKEQNLSR